MKTAILAIVFLLTGGAIGGFLGIGFGTGMGHAGGLVLGSQAGACLALQIARDKGILSSGQADTVIRDTVGKIKTKTPLASDPKVPWVGSEADCARMIAEMDRDTQAGQ
jgi:hypothetical protein